LISCQRHQHDEAQQQQSHPEIDFARCAIRPAGDHLKQMDYQQHSQELRGVMMQAPQQPAAGKFVLDVVNAFPCRLRAGAVIHPQEETGDELHRDAEHHRRPPEVSPARAPGYVSVKKISRQLPEPRPFFQPGQLRLHAAVTRSGRPA
jgi:hypothetical protein